VNRRRLKLVLAIGVMSVLGAVGVAVATGGKDIRERLSGYQEVPAISSPASGEFVLRMDRFSDELEYRLSYRGFDSNVAQAHIHFGDRHTNGGISVWLCRTTQPAPEGTPQCPAREGTVEGVIEADDVVGPGRTATAAGQGIEPGEFGEFIDALRAGVTYANVHTANFGGGEIRAQLRDRGRGR
jgi:hypothetical protein